MHYTVLLKTNVTTKHVYDLVNFAIIVGWMSILYPCVHKFNVSLINAFYLYTVCILVYLRDIKLALNGVNLVL